MDDRQLKDQQNRPQPPPEPPTLIDTNPPPYRGMVETAFACHVPGHCDLAVNGTRCDVADAVVRIYACVHEHGSTVSLCDEHHRWVDEHPWFCWPCVTAGHDCPVHVVREDPA
jgi:hypothetical protein